MPRSSKNRVTRISVQAQSESAGLEALSAGEQIAALRESIRLAESGIRDLWPRYAVEVAAARASRACRREMKAAAPTLAPVPPAHGGGK